MFSGGTNNQDEGGKIQQKVLPKDISLRISQLLTKDFLELEKTLSKNDICSLIFLLSDNYKDEIVLHDLCFKLLTDDLRTSNKFWPSELPGILLNYMEPSDEPCWKEKVVEALVVMQNYGVLKKWKFDVNDLKIAFKSTSRWHAVYINPLRKLLYLLCDNLDDNDWRLLCSTISIEKCLPKNDKQQCGMDFPEISLLHWSSKDIINISSLKNSNIDIIRKNLSHIGRDDWVAILADLTADDCYSIPRSSASLLPTELKSPSTLKETCSEDRYELSTRSGLCLIFNQELVTGYDEPREGTKKDAEYLEKTFKCFGFDVVVRNNVLADGIIKQICFYSDRYKPMSCFVVAILSHGERNVIKGSDGGDVNIDTIESTMLRIISLKDKPKVLIIQACQADVPATFSNSITTDSGPKGHLFVYMAALPGDVAYRHKVLGSYFINHLCDTLLENSENANWSEIIRICNAKMEKEKFAHLMPWHKCAFTKHLVLVAQDMAAAKEVLQEEIERRRIYMSTRN